MRKRVSCRLMEGPLPSVAAKWSRSPNNLKLQNIPETHEKC